MALVELLGEKVQGKNGEVDVSSLAGNTIGIYFSAHWCPPCRSFTPMLAEWYGMIKEEDADGSKIEIVFVSSDQDEEQFNGYYNEMPWCAVPFSNRNKKNDLSQKYGVAGIPTLVFVDGATGELITKDGRSRVSKGAKLGQLKN